MGVIDDRTGLIHPLLSHKSVKQNKDKEVARILRRAARKAGVVVCLGMVEHKDTVDADNEG